MKPKKKKKKLTTPPKTPVKFHNAFFKGNSTT
jgi:hypothetical protein